MRRGFVASVLAFGFVVATAFAAYARWGMGKDWPTVLKFWLLFFGAFALFPLGMGYAHRTAEALPLGLFRNRRAPREEDGGTR